MGYLENILENNNYRSATEKQLKVEPVSHSSELF